MGFGLSDKLGKGLKFIGTKEEYKKYVSRSLNIKETRQWFHQAFYFTPKNVLLLRLIKNGFFAEYPL